MVRVTSSRPSASARRLYPSVDRHAGHLERREELGAEPLRLRDGAARQLAAADAGGKPEVVFDARARPRLAARARGGRAGASAALPRRRTPRPRVRRGPPRRPRGRRPRRRPTAGGRDARPPGAAPGRVSTLPSSKNRAGSASVGHARRLEQRPRLGVPLDVEPAIRNEIARQEILDRVRSRRPLVSDQAQARRLGQGLGLPRVEEIVDHREEALLRRIPRLRQVVIEMRLVDGPDRRVDVRVRRQQDAPGQRIHLARPGEQLAAEHPRHALIADHHRQRVAAALQLAGRRERLRPRTRRS